jgi:hypothetical protein
MRVCNKLILLFFFFTIGTKAQKNISKSSIDSVFSIYYLSPINDTIDKRKTDSLRHCDFCIKKAELYIELRRKLKNKLDSAEKAANYHNTYIKDGYYHYVSYYNVKDFEWKGCNDFISKNGHRWSRITFCNHCDLYFNKEVTNCDVTIKKEQYFKIRLDGLIDSQTFYPEDLH